MNWHVEPILTRCQALLTSLPDGLLGPLLFALGVSGVALCAFKDIFQNLRAGLLIRITRPFRMGDRIVRGEPEGTVEDMQVRATGGVWPSASGMATALRRSA
ncbi:mechanosensitive ion channel domain-containing protein [Deinococcus sedimenti]|nr:mechanosensitive ion channel domain-containing protein [Deinococcus sedimenti]